MKILLVANYAPDAQVSMRRFAEAIARGAVARGHDVRVLSPPARLLPRVARRGGLGKWLGYVDKFVLFRRELRGAARGADVVHVCDHSNAMYVGSLRNVAHVVTCHDVIAIRVARGLDDTWRVGATGRLLQRLILSSLRRAEHVACVSEFTRDQFLELAPECARRTTVVHNGLNFPFSPASAPEIERVRAKFGLGQRPCFLHVGSALERKNRGHVVRTFAALRALRPALPHRLVFVGAPLGPDVEPALRDTGVGEHIEALGELANEELRALYSTADALLFPSLSEGFGWPVIEAQACGCPAFVSNRRPMTDVGGSAAVAIDPLDPTRAAATIAQSLPRLPAMRESSLANAARYTTARMVDSYLHLYARIAARADLGPQTGRPARD